MAIKAVERLQERMARLAALIDAQQTLAPQIEGYQLADLHAHLSRLKGREETLKCLSSHGILGLTYMDLSNTLSGKRQNKRNTLTFEDVLELYAPFIEQIDYALTRVDYYSNTGYVMRTQEIRCGVHDILAIGCTGDYLGQFKNPLDAIAEIHARNGAAVLNHPFVVPNDGILKKIIPYRFANGAERDEIAEILLAVDEIETFNAQCIDPTFGFIDCLDMRAANCLASDVAAASHLNGISASDAHLRLQQAKVSGIYFKEGVISKDRVISTPQIVNAIKSHDFLADERARNYVTFLSFMRGMFLG